MIDRIEFQNIRTNYTADLIYYNVFNIDYGTISTASKIGILSQESRSMSFTLNIDDFISSFRQDDLKYLDYKIVVWNQDGTREFAGFLKDNSEGLSYDFEENIVNIEIVDIWYFVSKAGDIANFNSKSAELTTEQTIILSLLSGLRDRLIPSVIMYHDSPLDGFFINQSLNVLSREIICWNSTILHRIKVTDGSTEFYYTNNPNISIYYTNDESIPVADSAFSIGDSNADTTTIRFIYLDTQTQYQKTPIDPNIIQLKMILFDFYYDKNNENHTEILGEKLRFKQTYQKVTEGYVYVNDTREYNFLDYKSDSTSGGGTVYSYWINVTNQPPNCYRKACKAGYIVTHVSTDGDNEYIVTVKNKTKDFQRALFIDYEIVDNVLHLYIHYLVKAWGIGSSFSMDEFDTDNSRSNYLYRKRTIKLVGYSIKSDDFLESFVSNIAERPYFYEISNSWDYGGTRDIEQHPGEQNYSLIDHWNQQNTAFHELYGFEHLPELQNTAVSLQNSKYMTWCRYDSSSEETNGKLYLDGKFVFNVTLNNNLYRYTLQIGSTNPMNDYNFTNSGLNFPSEPFYRNLTITRMSVYGAINLNSYIYSLPVNLSDALKLSVISNMFGLIQDNISRQIQVVNKLPVFEGVSITSRDIVKPKLEKIGEDYFSDSIFDPLSFENKQYLNTIITSFINNQLNTYKDKITFEYSSLISTIDLKIGSSFAYGGSKYSIISIKKINDYVKEIEGLKVDTIKLRFKIKINDEYQIKQAKLRKDDENKNFAIWSF